MMKAMRKLTKQILWVVIAAFVGTIIFAWGMEFSAKKQKRGILATVNGQEVNLNYFQSLYDQALKDAEKSKGEVDEETATQIREETWNQMVNNILLQQEIKKREIAVSDAELFEYLKRFPLRNLCKIQIFRPRMENLITRNIYKL